MNGINGTGPARSYFEGGDYPAIKDIFQHYLFQDKAKEFIESDVSKSKRGENEVVFFIN